MDNQTSVPAKKRSEEVEEGGTLKGGKEMINKEKDVEWEKKINNRVQKVLIKH